MVEGESLRAEIVQKVKRKEGGGKTVSTTEVGKFQNCCLKLRVDAD